MVQIVYRSMLALTGVLLLLSTPIQGGLEQQSPIDIQTWNAQNNEALGELKMEHYRANAKMINKGYEIEVAWSEYAGSLEIGDVEYKLKQCHWHHPSEHIINSSLRYPLELHMVHISDNDKIAVIGILYEIGPPDDFLIKLRNAIHDIVHIKEKEIYLGVVDPNKIGVERDLSYYRYNGSLTTYPFTEGVTWTVIKQMKTATHQQVNDLWDALHGKSNSRDVQPLNGRVVELYEDHHPIVDVSEICKVEETILSWSS